MTGLLILALVIIILPWEGHSQEEDKHEKHIKQSCSR